MHSRAAALFFVGLISLELSACAYRGGPATDTRVLDEILVSEPAERPRLWAKLRDKAELYELERVLLQSLPGHPGHAPGRARQAMLELLNDAQLQPAQQRLLRLRLLDLRHEMYLENALKERDQRLRSLIDIERDLHQSGGQ